MDWIRRVFGFPDSRPMPRSGNDSFKNPSWEEIFDNQDFNDRIEHPDRPFNDFHWDGSYSFGMGDNKDSFSSVFGQMDDMFRQLDSIMQHFHGHPGGHMIITEGPDFDNSSEAHSPRDSLLKKPESDVPGGDSSPHHRSPFQHGPFMLDPEQRKGDFGEGSDGFQDFGMRDPFDMMEGFFKSFGGGFRMIPFGENPGVPMLPNHPGTESEENPRDTLVKKEDTDVDDRITGGFSDLLKDMPKYDPPVVPGQPSLNSPEGMQSQPPRIQQRYHSTSIVRIRRSDGSVEETRKYTDSTGREEVTVTHTDPDEAASPGSLLRQGDQGDTGPNHFLPSLFSWFATR